MASDWLFANYDLGDEDEEINIALGWEGDSRRTWAVVSQVGNMLGIPQSTIKGRLSVEKQIIVREGGALQQLRDLEAIGRQASSARLFPLEPLVLLVQKMVRPNMRPLYNKIRGVINAHYNMGQQPQPQAEEEEEEEELPMTQVRQGTDPPRTSCNSCHTSN